MKKTVIIWFLPRIISQGLSAPLEAKVLSWLYAQLHEVHNCNADSILSIDRVIPKGIRWNPLSINGQKTKPYVGAKGTLESYNAGVGREDLIWVWIWGSLSKISFKLTPYLDEKQKDYLSFSGVAVFEVFEIFNKP